MSFDLYPFFFHRGAQIPAFRPLKGLLIAARFHGFRRTEKEIIHVVKVGDITLRKRYIDIQYCEENLWQWEGWRNT
jgi:hypothetical protein